MDPIWEHRLLETRRQFFGRAATGIGAAALASLLDPAVLATKRELEMLVRSGPLCQIPPRLSGWREQVMTRKLLNIMGH